MVDIIVLEYSFLIYRYTRLGSIYRNELRNEMLYKRGSDCKSKLRAWAWSIWEPICDALIGIYMKPNWIE